jgi:predicted dehydrogenase
MRLVAACDINPQNLEKFATFFYTPRVFLDFQEMLAKEKLDAVICAANAQTHFEVAKACLQAGVHVFVEKTPCETAAQARELSELSKKAGKVVAVGFNRRYATAYALAKDIIASPSFGASMYYSKFNASVYGSNDYFVFNHIIHHIDLARFLLGEIKLESTLWKKESDASCASVISFTSEKGVIGTIQCASMLEEAYPMERLDIAGTGGNVVVDNLKGLRWNRTAPARDKDFASPLLEGGDCLSWNPSHGYGLGNGVFSYIGMEAELAAFAEAIQSGKANGCVAIGDCVGTMSFMEDVRRVAGEKLGFAVAGA